MNNSSDSDNNDISKIKMDTPKKRGRPRKNLFIDKSPKEFVRKEILSFDENFSRGAKC